MKDNQKIIPVFYACDDNFVKYTIVSLKSMMENASKEGKYDLVVLRADRPDMDIKECFTRLSSYLSENGKLIFACENALGLNFL